MLWARFMANQLEQVRRGALVFTRIAEDQIKCTLGEPNDAESEFVFQVHESFVDDMIAGLVALRNNK